MEAVTKEPVACQEGEMVVCNSSDFHSSLQSFLEHYAMVDKDPASENPRIARFRQATYPLKNFANFISNYIPDSEGETESDMPVEADLISEFFACSDQIGDDFDDLAKDFDPKGTGWVEAMVKDINDTIEANAGETWNWNNQLPTYAPWFDELHARVNAALVENKVGAWFPTDDPLLIPEDWQKIVSYAKPLAEHLFCPSCGVRHVDTGEWSYRAHKTHRCVDYTHYFKGNPDPHHVKGCGHEWRPFEHHTIGIPSEQSLTAREDGSSPWIQEPPVA